MLNSLALNMSFIGNVRVFQLLSSLAVHALEFSRLRKDLIKTCKILEGLDRLDGCEWMFPLVGLEPEGTFRIRNGTCRIKVREQNVLTPTWHD